MKRAFCVCLLACAAMAAPKQKLTVKVIDSRFSETDVNYFVPGTATTTAEANCAGSATNVNCRGTSQTTAIPARSGTYSVRGATYTLELPDGRLVVVNCESKYRLRFDGANARSCRMPTTREFKAEFDGDKAKLIWPVSLDGKKADSETYKIIAIPGKAQ